jgi:hypothetical protein
MLPVEGAAARELRAVDAAIVGPDDVAGARAAVEAYVEQWQTGTLPTPALDDDIRTRISRQTQAEALAGLIRTTAARS